MKIQRYLIRLCLLALLALAATPVLAKTTTATYKLSCWTTDGGGISNLIVGNYTLSGSAG